MNDFQFGDIIENGWASDGNPTKRGVFIRYEMRSGRVNPGKFAVLRSDGGSFGQFYVDAEAKLTKVGTIFDAHRAEIERLRTALSEIIGYDRNLYDNGRPGYEAIARAALEASDPGRNG